MDEQELIISAPKLSTEQVVLSPSSSDDQFRLVFNFSCKRIILIFEDSSEELPMVAELELPCLLKSMRFDIQETSMDCLRMLDTMIQGLFDFPLLPMKRVELATNAVDIAWDLLVTCMPHGHNQLNLDLDFTAFSRGVYDHDILTLHTTEGDHMIPATDVSIESLETKTLDSCNENAKTGVVQSAWKILNPVVKVFFRCHVLIIFTRLASKDGCAEVTTVLSAVLRCQRI